MRRALLQRVRPRRLTTCIGLALGGLTAAPGALRAQPAVASGKPVLTGIYHDWTPATPVGNDSVRVVGIQQIAAPIVIRAGETRRVSLDITGAYAMSRVTVQRAGKAPVVLPLDGPTDVRALLSIAAFGDHVAVLLGGTGPLGRIRLSADELTALGAIGAPAVGAPVPVFGTGGSGNAGLATSWQVGSWSLTGGGSFERRFRFAPFGELAAGAPVTASLAPGSVLTLSARGRGDVLGTGVTVDANLRQFRADTFSITQNRRNSTVVYRLGAITNFTVRVEPPVPVVRDAVLQLARQSRAPYEVLGLGAVDGSNASQLSLSAAGTLFARGGFRVAGGLERRSNSGIRADSTLVAAAFHEYAASMSIGLPLGSAEVLLTGAVASGSVTLRNREPIAMRRYTLRGQWNVF